jgi:hypothetical protein
MEIVAAAAVAAGDGKSSSDGRHFPLTLTSIK